MAISSKDKGTIKRLRDGDHSALRHIYNDQYDIVFRFAFYKIRDIAESQDIVSEAFVKLWKERQKIMDYQHAERFLYTVVSNACSNFLRDQHKKRAREKEVAYLSEFMSNSDQLIEARYIDEVYREIDNLPQKCKEILKLIIFENLDTHEVAEKLQISKQNVLNQKAKAIGILRNIVQQRAAVAILIFLDLLLTYRQAA
jgi:RNA polymerase sigma-70 factor (ECF subfamily)